MTCTNGRKKGFKNFRWEANRSKDREFSPKVMNYFSNLLNNSETLCISVLKERLDMRRHVLLQDLWTKAYFQYDSYLSSTTEWKIMIMLLHGKVTSLI